MGIEDYEEIFPDAIRVDPKVHGVDTIVESLKKVGLPFEFADLWAEYNAE